MRIENQILSDIVIHMKYAKYLPEKKRRETWNEIVNRNKNMHIKKFPFLKDEIEKNYKLVYEKKVLPSMRANQFSGKPIEINNARIFNCSYLPIENKNSFSEIMFLLLSGCGVGYSVQTHHIERLPEIRKPLKSRRYLVGDSIEGWADAIRMLFKSYFGYAISSPEFDFRDIRPKGTQLITAGGKAPGAEPLKIALTHIQAILDRKQDGEKLTSLECHDIICHMADAVLSGGIRRAALISFFNLDDNEMLTCKFGDWWELNPQRGRANNSAVLMRNKVTYRTFIDLWEKIKLSNSGEPGFFFTNDKDMLANPCIESSLKPNQMCNLGEINVSNIESQEDLEERARVASFIGTLQASYTDFHYLRDIWRKTTEKEALLGISLTGIASGRLNNLDLEKTTQIIKDENIRIANLIGINPSYRLTVVKPSGTASLVLGTSSGIHSWHSKYYIRRIRIGKDEALYEYLMETCPSILEDDIFKPHLQSVISIPQKAPEGAITRKDESAIELLERIKDIQQRWIKPGHVKGSNTHNISATITMKPHEWEEVGEWLYKNKKFINAASFLPEDLGTYKQAPYEEITEEEYHEKIQHLTKIDLKKVKEKQDLTNFSDQVSCSGNSCEII